MVAPALWTVIREVMHHWSKPQWLGCRTLIGPEQFLQSTTGSFLQLLPLLFSVLLDFCFLNYSFDITYLFQSLPSSLLSLKVSQSPQRHTKNPHPAHFYPIASPHRTLCNPLCAFLPPLPPPVQGCPLTIILIQKNVKQIFGGGEEGICRKHWDVFNKILVSSFSWHLFGGPPCKDEAEYLLPSQMNASITLSREAHGRRHILVKSGRCVVWSVVGRTKKVLGRTKKVFPGSKVSWPTAEYARFGVRGILVTDQELERGNASLLKDALGMPIQVFSVWWFFYLFVSQIMSP